MTQEDKELLFKDLSARLSYGVICQVDDEAAGLNDGKLVIIDIPKELVRFDAEYWDAYIDDIKPYLRPMSSMTEEECKELGELSATIENVGETLPNVPYYIEVARPEQIDWLNARHFDYRGLIEKGLAIEVTEENNPYKTELL